MKIGLLGYGFMGGAHAAAIMSIPSVTLAAVASRVRPADDAPTRGNLDLKSTPLPRSVRWTSDWRTVVDDPGIDAVDVCLPTHMHQEVIESALANGKHVLCEKPMALTQAECEQLLIQAEEAQRTFMVAQVLRWMFPYQYAFNFVSSVGREAVTVCQLQRSTGFPGWSEWLGQQHVSGGAILDLLSHDLDQALQWFGEPQTVSAVSIGEVDTMRGTLRYNSGLEVVVEGGWMAPEVSFSASYQLASRGEELLFADGHLTRTRNREDFEVAIPKNDPYKEEIAYFVECCRSGQPPLMCLPAESARAVELALLLRRSREEGRELAWR